METVTDATRQQVGVEKVVSAADNDSVAHGTVQRLDEKIVKHSHDADAAMKAFEGLDGQVIELTAEKNKALLRKIDWHMMPVSIALITQPSSGADWCRSCVLSMGSTICQYAMPDEIPPDANWCRDKTTLSYASVMGFRLPHSSNKLASGVNLTSDHYQWLGSMFYFGYIAWEYPTTRLLQMLPLGKYSAFNIIMWVSTQPSIWVHESR